MRLPRLFARLFKRGATMSETDMSARLQRAAERILDDETLTDGLDDEAGKGLVRWGVARARRVAQSTAGLDDAAADEAMGARLRATRRLMRLVTRWAAAPPGADPEDDARWAAIAEQAARVYGPPAAPLAAHREDAARVRAELAGDRPRMIGALLALLDRLHGETPDSQGEPSA